MSALAKPCIHTTTSDAGADGAVVNVENMMSMSKSDIPAATTNAKDRFNIDFKVLGTDNQVNTVSWVFMNVATPAAARDAAFAAALSLMSAAV